LFKIEDCSAKDLKRSREEREEGGGGERGKVKEAGEAAITLLHKQEH
jgi:hypothetical protein